MRSTLELPIRVLTHNIRYATSTPFKGERPWPERRQLVLNELMYHIRHAEGAFICLQEVLHNQLEDICRGLNHGKESSKFQEWAYIGVGREDGQQAGEYSPIFYKPSVWNLLHWETVWLSETPGRPSKGWDAASTRIVTIGVFTHRTSGITLLALNTHLDDQGSRSRLEAARIIRSKIHSYHQGKFAPLLAASFLAGDLNSEEKEEAYSELTGSGGLLDTYKLVDSCRRYGNHHTFTGFGYEEEQPSRIDYVLLGSLGHGHLFWRVDGYSVLANKFDDEIFSSDHCAVVADLTLVD